MKLKTILKHHISALRKTLIIIISLVVVAVSFFTYAHFFGTKIQSAWWDDLWAYRKAVPVTNNTTEQDNVYIVVSNINASANFKSNCGDMRWLDSNNKVLPYYIISGCGTSNMTVHVFFSIFPAGAQTIYYYYGNPTAPDGFSAKDFSTVASNYSVGSIPATAGTAVATGGWWP